MFADAFDDCGDRVGMHEAGRAAAKENSIYYATR